jgi:nicotinate-nucleotide adenylyltransferase
MRIGILGGTFNPIHLAHLRIAEEAADRFGLDRVLFMPAASPPHKPLAGELSFAERTAMVRLAVAGNPRFAVSELEGERGGKSYSVDTLRHLREQYPDDELFFIVGSDSFRDFSSWREYAAIFSLCNMVVADRPDAVITSLYASLPVAITGEFCYYDAEQRLAHRSGFSVYHFKGEPLHISSSAIRELVRQGRSIRYLVPDPVVHYIKEQGFYQHGGK